MFIFPSAKKETGILIDVILLRYFGNMVFNLNLMVRFWWIYHYKIVLIMGNEWEMQVRVYAITNFISKQLKLLNSDDVLKGKTRQRLGK